MQIQIRVNRQVTQSLTMSLTLPQLFDSNPTEYKELPHVLPQFFMPRLQDRPQDPIMDTLRIKRESNGREPRLRQPPAEPVKLKESYLDTLGEGTDLFWERTAKEGVRVQVRCPPVDGKSYFLDAVFRVKSGLGIRCDPLFLKLHLWVPFYPSNRTARSQQLAIGISRLNFPVRLSYPGFSSINPRLQDPDLYVLHVSMKDLFVSIQNMLVGNSSSLYQWDPLSEAFVLPPTTDGKQTFIVVDGKDDLLMQRYGLLSGLLERFFTHHSQLHKAFLNNRWPTTPTRLICE